MLIWSTDNGAMEWKARYQMRDMFIIV